MARGNTGLDNYEYDNWLSKNGKAREVRERTQERKKAHDQDGRGWHFGLSDQPIKCEDRKEFDKVLESHGLMRASEVDKKLR